MKASINAMRAAIGATILASTGALAGNFEVWTYNTGSTMDVVVSFSGEGKTQDSQLDFQFPDWAASVKAEVVVPGSVCVASKEAGIIRAVPPSGAGEALSSKAVDYCRFSLKAKPGVERTELGQRFVECASPGGASACGVKVIDVSDTPGRGKPTRTGNPDLQPSKKGVEE